MSKIVFFIYHLVTLNGLKISQYSTLNNDSMVLPHKFYIPIATDVRSNRSNTSVSDMTNYRIQTPNPYPYRIGPWNNDGKNQKICQNITDALSPLPNQKSYLIEFNLSPPTGNIKEHHFSQISWPQTFAIQFRIHSLTGSLQIAQNKKKQIQLSAFSITHT
jgi:hypothetical protein